MITSIVTTIFNCPVRANDYGISIGTIRGCRDIGKKPQTEETHSFFLGLKTEPSRLTVTTSAMRPAHFSGYQAVKFLQTSTERRSLQPYCFSIGPL